MVFGVLPSVGSLILLIIIIYKRQNMCLISIVGLLVNVVTSRKQTHVGTTRKPPLRGPSFGVRTVVAPPLLFRDENGTKVF